MSMQISEAINKLIKDNNHSRINTQEIKRRCCYYFFIIIVK